MARNKVCVVIGAGDATGGAIARRFAREGFTAVVTRRTADYLVEAKGSGTPWSQLRLAHLDEDSRSSAVQCGVYACSPKQAGFAASFRTFSLVARERE